MEDLDLIKILVKLANENRFIAFGLGAVFALYLLGRLSGDEDKSDWEFTDPDKAIAFHEKRIEVWKQVRADRKYSSERDVLRDLLEEVGDLREALDKLDTEQPETHLESIQE